MNNENKMMRAVDFLDNKVQVEFLKPKRTYSESHRLAYCITALISLDLADNFRELAERKEISNVAIDFFDKKATEEYAFIEKLAKEQGKQKLYYDDFEVLTETIDVMTEKVLSEFQMKSFPMLKLLLKTIFEIKLISESVCHVASAEGKIMEPKMRELLDFKLREIKRSFNKYYTQVSNKAFDFRVYDKIFEELPRSSYNDYVKLLKNLSNKK